MTLELIPHKPQYTLRRCRQSHEQYLRGTISAAWAWVAQVHQDAMNCSCRNKHFGPAPPNRLLPTTFINCRYSRYLPPRTCALRTRYDTGNVPAETRHPQVHSLQGQTLPRDPSVIPTLSQRPIAPHNYKTPTTTSKAQHSPPKYRATHRPHPGLSPPAHPTRMADLDPHRGHHRDHLITDTNRDNTASCKNSIDCPPGSLAQMGTHTVTPSLNEMDLTYHSLANAC